MVAWGILQVGNCPNLEDTSSLAIERFGKALFCLWAVPEPALNESGGPVIAEVLKS